MTEAASGQFESGAEIRKRSVFDSVLGVWKDHRIGALFFFVGVTLELVSIEASYFQAPILDSFFSLLSGYFLIMGGIVVIARIGYYNHFIPFAASLFVASKILAFTRTVPFLADIPLFGENSAYNVAVEGGMFSIGAMMMLIAGVGVTIEIQLARRDLERRHAALLRKTEELEATERALRVSENLHNALMENVPDSIYYKDAQLRFTKINRALGDYYGLADPDEAMGRLETEFLAPQYAEHLHRHELALLENGQAVVDHVELEDTRDGRQRYVSTTQAPILAPDGSIAGIVGIRRDISERRAAAEERQRLVTAIEQADVSVVITDAEGAMVYVNPAYEHRTGYTAEEVDRLPLAFLSDAQDDPSHPMQTAINEGESWRGRLTIHSRNGTAFEELVVLSPVHDEETGDIINFVAMRRDITHEMTLERQLQQTRKMDALGKLAGGIAHDFRNVLAIARGNCELALSHTSEGDPLREHLRSTLGALDRGHDLVRRILIFSKQQPPAPEPLDLAAETAESMRLIGSTLPGSVRLETALDADAGAILADRTQLNQALMNLCTNAVDAMNEGNGVLSVRVTQRDLETALATDTGDIPPGKYVCLEVADTGTGIPEEYRNRIFELFFTSKPDGTGFGLQTVQAFAAGAGGGIRVQSAPGQGASFSLFFPKMESETVSRISVPAEKSAAKTVAQPPSGGTMRILVVDDDPNLIETTVDVLHSLGYATIARDKAREALDVLLEGAAKVDVLLTDRIMPEMDGLALAKALAHHGIDLPVVLMSGNSDEFVEAHRENPSIVDWVSKPFSIERLHQVIEKAAASRRKE